MEVIQRICAIEGLVTYLSLATILSFLILHDYFKGRQVDRRQGYISLCLVILLFLVGRTIVLAAGETVPGGRVYPEAVWGLLNFTCFILVASLLTGRPASLSLSGGQTDSARTGSAMPPGPSL